MYCFRSPLFLMSIKDMRKQYYTYIYDGDIVQPLKIIYEIVHQHSYSKVPNTRLQI